MIKQAVSFLQSYGFDIFTQNEFIDFLILAFLAVATVSLAWTIAAVVQIATRDRSAEKTYICTSCDEEILPCLLDPAYPSEERDDEILGKCVYCTGKYIT